MFRVLIVLAAALAASAAAAAPGSENPPRLTSKEWADARRWIEAHLDTEDWMFVGGADTTQIWFVSSLPQAEGEYPIVRDWLRWEITDDQKGSRSTLMQIEVDCAKQRSRGLDYYHYAGNNLRGRFYTGEESPEAWKPVPKGSVAETYVQTICRSAR